MTLQEALAQLLQGRDLSRDAMTDVMQQVMSGGATPAQIGGLLVALRIKGETVDEVAAAASVMRSLAERVSLNGVSAIDIVGTGGDASSTFNISTCSAIVAAAAGIAVAKHGNRAVSSKSGAADLLEAAGVNIELNAGQVTECIQRCGIGFMFAPKHHGAMKHAVGPRREMGVRTIFNLLGPLTNPAEASCQLLGVYAKEWVRPMAEVLQKLGSDHVIVVHGDDGMDEISLSGPTSVAELKDGDIREYRISPADFGLDVVSPSVLKVDSPDESLRLVQAVLDGESGPARDIVLLNSGAAICVGGKANDIAAGVAMAREVIDSGAAVATLAALVQVSREVSA